MQGGVIVGTPLVISVLSLYHQGWRWSGATLNGEAAKIELERLIRAAPVSALPAIASAIVRILKTGGRPGSKTPPAPP